MKKVLFVILLFTFYFLLANKLSPYFFDNRTSYEYPLGIAVPGRTILLPLVNFDGKHYLNIALNNYPLGDKLSVFFPLYSLLIRVLSLNLILNPIIIGLAISFVSSIVGLLVLYKIIQADYSSKVAFKTIFLLLLFPSSFYFFCFYTEGLFFLLVMLTFWFLKKNNLLLASLFTAFATATRMIGLALIPVLLYEAFVVYKKKKKLSWSVLISPLGFIVYTIYTNFRFKETFLMISSQAKDGFDRPFGILGPYFALRDAVLRVFAGPQPTFDNPFVYPVIVLELLFAVFAIIVLILSYFKLSKTYWLYLASSIAIIFIGGVISAIGRYLLVIFPIFIYLSLSLSRKSFWFWCLISLLLLTFASSLFLRGYWFA